MYPGVHAATAPDRPAVIMSGSGRTLTYRELDDRSLRLADVLRRRGLRRGDVVALFSDNCPEVSEVYWAALRSGLYVCAVNSHLGAEEAAYIIDDSGARALISSAALAEVAAALPERLPRVELLLAHGGAVPGHGDYERALAAASAERPAHQPAGADLLYSSGTTGRPKGIKPALPDREVDEPDEGGLSSLLQQAFGFGPGMVYLSPAPAYHSAPLRYCGSVQAVGGTVVMMERFDPAEALRAVERYRVTHSQWVPTMFVRMLKLDPEVRARHDLSSMRVAVHAAAPCPVDVKRAMIDWWGPVLWEYYAATEGIGMTLIDSARWLDKPGSVGTGLLGELRICDDDGAELPAGEVGTVYFARDELTFEYLGDPEKTRSARHPEHPGWATVGDLGYLDEDGYLFLTDRKAFMIISGGVNIYPQEVENALALHPEVADVAVWGGPPSARGYAVKAGGRPAPGAEPGPELAERILRHVRDRLAHYKTPRSVDFVDALPRTPTGKLVKGELKKRYAS
ncbi:acyl-CoA synthetase [Saccharopolyspora cebuensis]|uniref:Acyl-CoA synthetase n=1 Tax=Saccharopolyspora cebuensis TaxID=418759 RepID=A0ABV4CIL7_9PSEU